MTTDDEPEASVLARLDDAKLNRFQLKIMFISGMGFFTDAYDLFVIGIAVAILKTQWHLSTTEVSLLSSTTLAASAFGAVIFGRIADIFGRKKLYGIEVLILAVGAVATAFAPSIGWLIAFRVVLGIGIGGDYPVSSTIMSEYAARKNRGRMVALVFAMQGAGLVIGPLIAIALLSAGISHDAAWRIMLGLGAVPALAVFWLRRQIRETPRFLLAQMEAKESEEKARREHRPTGLRGLVADRRMLRWLLGVSLTWFLFDIAYYGNTIASPMSVKLVAPHADLVNQTAIILAIFAVAALPGYALAAATIDHIGRKLMQAGGFALMGTAFLGLWLIPGATTDIWLFLVLFGTTYLFAEFGPNTTTFVYPAEIFPVRVRTTSHGIAAAAGKLGGFVGTYALTTLLPALGLARTAVIPAAACVVGALLTVVLLPEPKAKSLEELTEDRHYPPSAVTLGVAESRGTRPASA